MNCSSLVSIIMPLFNSKYTISNSIVSVLSQTYSNWELIICDDGSEDNSINIVYQFTLDKRIKLIFNQFEKGVCGARNSCLMQAKGRYICFLDSDDIWLPNKLETQLLFMQENELAFSYGDYLTFCQDQDIKNSFKNNPKYLAPKKLTIKNLVRSCSIGCLTAMIDTNKIPDFIFPNSPKEDYAAWLVFFKKHSIIAKKYPGILAAYRLSTNSLSGKKMKEIAKQYHVLKAYTDSDFIIRMFNLTSYVFKGFIKKYYFYVFK